MGNLTFFVLLNLFVANPFDELILAGPDGVRIAFAAEDGRGLNPLLQYVLNVIHPPILYTGFVGFVVPFAFAIGAMASRQLGDTWIRTTRRWTMVAWFFLGTGILLGGKWAYVELGWGGYWAWDPVENASLMPWLLGTAFLHSVMIQEKKGMMKVWNMVLIILAFAMTLYGTFLTRSGIVSSVHAFAQSSIGGYFLAFIILTLASSFYLLYDRAGYLRTENSLEAIASRESSFMFNNLLFVLATFAILWGVMLPVLSEWVQDQKMTVGPPWFDAIMVPIGLMLLAVTGIGPLLAWRRSSLDSLKRAFLYPITFALAAFAGMIVSGVRHPYALIALTLCVFVASTVVQEFWKGTRARSSITGERWPLALVDLTLRNTRRYGGFVVHFGIVLLFVGFTGQAFHMDAQADLGVGEDMALGNYVLRVEALETRSEANYDMNLARIAVFRDGIHVANMYPEIRFYRAGEGQQTREPSIRSTLQEDLYIVFAGVTPDGREATIQADINPLVMWVWIGGIVVALGTMIAMLPNKRSGSSKKEDAAEEDRRAAPTEDERVHA
jgi:cytochrome c-type biogenesis protein CcmF